MDNIFLAQYYSTDQVFLQYFDGSSEVGRIVWNKGDPNKRRTNLYLGKFNWASDDDLVSMVDANLFWMRNYKSDECYKPFGSVCQGPE